MIQETLPRAVNNLAEAWEGAGLDIRDYLLAGSVRDAIKLELSEQGGFHWTVCTDKERILGAAGENLSRIHNVRVKARQHNLELAKEQTRLILRVNQNIREYIALCEKLGVDWSDDLHDLMRTRPGPAPTKTTTDEFDIHLCTELPAVQEAVDIVHSSLEEIRCYCGDNLANYLQEQFDDDQQDKAIKYIEELIIIGVYIGPVGRSEAETPEWAFHLKGRALQHAHKKFGLARVANDDRYLFI
jgi:hypothetical protein